jgi:hypothetical protein
MRFSEEFTNAQFPSTKGTYTKYYSQVFFINVYFQHMMKTGHKKCMKWMKHQSQGTTHYSSK